MFLFVLSEAHKAMFDASSFKGSSRISHASIWLHQLPSNIQLINAALYDINFGSGLTVAMRYDIMCGRGLIRAMLHDTATVALLYCIELGAIVAL